MKNMTKEINMEVLIENLTNDFNIDENLEKKNKRINYNDTKLSRIWK